MMDKKPHIKPYLYGMLAGFGAIALSIIFFFLIYRFDGFGSAISTLTGILMPFIYGAVIAYLLKPVCNSIENFLRRFIPEKMNGLINALSVALTILFGLLLVYALVMMIVPQLITSVTTLYYTAQANITKFMNWANHLEFIEKNEQITELLNSAYAALNTNLDTWNTWLKNTLLPSMQNIVSGAAIGVLNVVTVAKNLIIGIIVAVYMLASRKRFVQQGKLVLHSIVRPRWAQLITEEVKYADKMFGGFINGKIMDSAIIGVLCYIGCLIFKFPSALLVSVIIGVTNVIPFFGPSSVPFPPPCSFSSRTPSRRCVRAVRTGFAAAGRQHHRTQDSWQHHRPFQLLGTVRHPAVWRPVGLCGHDRWRAAVRRYLRRHQKAGHSRLAAPSGADPAKQLSRPVRRPRRRCSRTARCIATC